MPVRRKIDFEGPVHAVGFRLDVCRHALERELPETVSNTASGLTTIEIHGRLEGVKTVSALGHGPSILTARMTEWLTTTSVFMSTI